MKTVDAVPSTTISDNYEGSDANSYGGVVGTTANFQISSMGVSLSGDMLSEFPDHIRGQV